jgi:zinc protease
VRVTGAREGGLVPVRRVLGNGVVVLTARTTSTPAVTIHASFAAGTVWDPPATTGLSHFVSRVIDRGTVTRTAADIADALDDRGVSLGVTVNRLALSCTCTCLVEDLDAVLQILADVLRAPAFPDAEVEVRRAEIVTLIRQDDDNPAVRAAEGVMTLLYGESHPFGWRPRGTVESLARLGRQDLEAFHASRMRPGCLTVAVVGDVSAERAVGAVEAALGEWQAEAPRPLRLPAPVAPDTRRIRVVEMMNKAQTDIAYGFTAIRRDAPEYYAAWLMNNILGEYAIGGRLGDSIRERQGMAYYVFSGLDASVIPGPLVVRAGVSPANVDRTIQSIDEELARMVADGPTEQEFTESRQFLIGALPRRLETNAAIAAFLQTVEFFGLGLDYHHRVPDLLARVSMDDVRAAARQLLDPARASIVVAGPYRAPA